MKVSTAAAADLRLVLAAATLKVVATEISDGDQTTQVADVDTVRITDLEQSFPQELCRTVSYLTVTFHLTKTQATVPEHTCSCFTCFSKLQTLYEGRSKSFAIQCDTQLTQAKRLYYFST